MQFTFVRHGETTLNREGILQGHLDSDLSNKGLCQATTVANKLKGQHFTQIGCSPLKRSRQTAEVLSQILQIPICEYPELIERNYGPWQGMAYRKIRFQFRPLFQEMGEWTLSDHFCRTPFPGIESYQQIIQRLTPLMQRLKSPALLVTHSGVLSAILLQLKYPSPHVPVFRSTGYISVSTDSSKEEEPARSSVAPMSLVDCEGLLSEEELRRCIPLNPQDPFVLF
jgi:phosphoserine phosphatase